MQLTTKKDKKRTENIEAGKKDNIKKGIELPVLSFDKDNVEPPFPFFVP